MSLAKLMTMAVQCYIPILSEWAIWCAKGRVYCTFTPKTRCNLSSKEHQCTALTAAWKEQGTASLTVGTPSKPFFHFPFHFWHHKIHFNLTLSDVWWALISLRSLCFKMYLFCFDISLCATLPKERGWGRIPQQLKCSIFMESSYYGL